MAAATGRRAQSAGAHKARPAPRAAARVMYTTALFAVLAGSALATASAVATASPPAPVDPTASLSGAEISTYLGNLDSRTKGEELAAITKGCYLVREKHADAAPHFIEHVNPACLKTIHDQHPDVARYMLSQVHTKDAAVKVVRTHKDLLAKQKDLGSLSTLLKVAYDEEVALAAKPQAASVTPLDGGAAAVRVGAGALVAAVLFLVL